MIDVGEQDKALAQQIERDQAALAAIHQTVEETRLATEDLRVETAAQKKKLDKSMRDAQEGAGQAQEAREGRQARARPPEGRVRAAGEEQEGPQEGDRPGPGQPARAGQADRPDHRAAAGAREHPLEVQRQLPLADGRPHQRGVRLQQLSGLWARLRLCPLPQRHRHRGRATATPVRAAGKGTVVYVGWNYADGSDPAWIVVIAHSVEPADVVRPPAAEAARCRWASTSSAGQVIGYEGNTGNSTGAHLHWMVELNGAWKNPRLFL